jgi:hypothetical protein
VTEDQVRAVEDMVTRIVFARPPFRELAQERGDDR